jgi:hypothetical protein
MSNNIHNTEEELLIEIDRLDNKSFDMECVIRDVNSETKAIKYDDIPMNIYIKIQSLAEANGIDEKELEWKIDEVRDAVNKLESAIYDLVEPFEDKKRDIDNEKDELEYELEDVA